MSSPKEPMEGPPVQTTHSVLPEPAIRIELDGRMQLRYAAERCPGHQVAGHRQCLLTVALENLRVQVSGEPGFCEPWEARLSKIPHAGSSQQAARVGSTLTLSPVYLDDLTERVRPRQLRVKLYASREYPSSAKLSREFIAWPETSEAVFHRCPRSLDGVRAPESPGGGPKKP